MFRFRLALFADDLLPRKNSPNRLFSRRRRDTAGHGLRLQTLGANFWFPGRRRASTPNDPDLPPICRPASGPGAKLELLDVCKFRRGPRNRSCSLDVYLLPQRDPTQLEQGSRMLKLSVSFNYADGD